LKGDLQFTKFLKNTICIGLCKLKCTEKRFIPFTPLHFLPEFVPHTEFKGRPENAKWNVLNHTSFRNYAPFSLQVPSILSILLGLEGGDGERKPHSEEGGKKFMNKLTTSATEVKW